MRHARDRAPGTRRPGLSDRRDADASPLQSQPAENLLALQRSAGNRAVSALLARSPDTAQPKEGEKSGAAAGACAALPGIGTIQLLSLSFGDSRPPVVAREGTGKAQGPREIHFSSRPGEHSTALQKAALDGKPMDVDVTLPRGTSTLRLKLKNAIVSSYSTSGADERAIESWTLNFEALEQSSEGESGK